MVKRLCSLHELDEGEIEWVLIEGGEMKFQKLMSVLVFSP